MEIKKMKNHKEDTMEKECSNKEHHNERVYKQFKTGLVCTICWKNVKEINGKFWFVERK